MGEEVKKPEEEKKAEDAKPKAAEEPPKTAEEPKKEGGEEKPAGDAPAAEAAAAPPPPPEEIEMRVFMHCEGCARKVRRCLKGFDGVEDVKTDCRTHKVVVKGKKAAADPLKVVERVQKKTGRKVELLTPLPPPPPPKEEEKKEEEKPKVEEKKEEPVVIAVVLKVHMHCEGCAQEIKKRILKMKGVQAAEPELKASQVAVKGVFEPARLVEYVYKRTGKHAAVVKTEPEKKPDDEKAKEEEKALKDDKKAEGEKAQKEGEGSGDGKGKKEVVTEEAAMVASLAAAASAGGVKVEQKRNEFYYYYPRYPVEYAYPPQMFSDENPNACSVM